MGMDMMYYEESVRESRCKQAYNTIEEINEIIDKFYNREPRAKLNERNDELRKENLELRRELKKYKEIIDNIQIIQGEVNDD